MKSLVVSHAASDFILVSWQSLCHTSTSSGNCLFVDFDRRRHDVTRGHAASPSRSSLSRQMRSAHLSFMFVSQLGPRAKHTNIWPKPGPLNYHFLTSFFTDKRVLQSSNQTCGRNRRPFFLSIKLRMGGGSGGGAGASGTWDSILRSFSDICWSHLLMFHVCHAKYTFSSFFW